MRKIIGVAVFCLVACSFFLTVQPAFGASYYADMDTTWWHNDQDVSTTQFTHGGLYDYSFGIFEIGAETNEVVINNFEPIILGAGQVFQTTLNFNLNTNGGTDITISTVIWDTVNSWIVNQEVVDPVTVHFNNLGDFGFFFSDSAAAAENPHRAYDYMFTEIPNSPGNDWYELNWMSNVSGEHQVLVQDAIPLEGTYSPVPVPTALILLGSGLVGLAGFRRKMD